MNDLHTRLVQRARTALPRLWRSVPGLQWRLLHLTQPTFLVGVSALLRTSSGEFLLVKNAFWPAGQQWGMPTGYLEQGETLTESVTRELHEEIGGGTVEDLRVLDMTAGYRMRVEVLVEGTVKDLPSPREHDSLEVSDHRLATLEALPQDLHPGHRDLLRKHAGPTAPQ
ncbi:NUDIX hydrolase [Brachybacterium muris]|uniref:NUDIX hydrolase n=1 Tax=Brachybacterium muris TaxID=219301 RepID=UPI0021A7F23B|nr:NUDIX hydrolase [Brachybacterium muris]MCT1430392.1 NUDIX hydrolase [Brachybacterium muris]